MSTTQARLARLLTVFVALDAMLLSYEALAWRAARIGIGGALPLPELPLGLIFPLALDGLLGTAMLAAYVLRTRELRVRGYVWGVIAYGIGVSILGNALPPQTPTLVADLLRATPPISLALSLHLLILLNTEPRSARSASEGEQESEQAATSDSPTGTVRVLPLPEQGTRTARARRALEEARVEGRTLTAPELVEASGPPGERLSASSARRMLAEMSKGERLVVDSR